MADVPVSFKNVAGTDSGRKNGYTEKSRHGSLSGRMFVIYAENDKC